MTTVLKWFAVLAAAGGLTLGVVALADENAPEEATIRSESVPATPTPDGRVEADDRPLWPEEARQARAAALRVTNGGTVSEADHSDDPGERYEVEVVKDGREYDIALDVDFKPVPNRRYDD